MPEIVVKEKKGLNGVNGDREVQLIDPVETWGHAKMVPLQGSEVRKKCV